MEVRKSGSLEVWEFGMEVWNFGRSNEKHVKRGAPLGLGCWRACLLLYVLMVLLT